MTAWRVIITDSEGLTGVAPVCSNHQDPEAPNWVFDCCPGPHIECWSPPTAKTIAADLTLTDAEACS